MKDYKALAEALRRRIKPQDTIIHVGVKLAQEIVDALEEAEQALSGGADHE